MFNVGSHNKYGSSIIIYVLVLDHIPNMVYQLIIFDHKYVLILVYITNMDHQ